VQTVTHVAIFQSKLNVITFSKTCLPAHYLRQFLLTFLVPEHLLSSMPGNVVRQIHKLLSHYPAITQHQTSDKTFMVLY